MFDVCRRRTDDGLEHWVFVGGMAMQLRVTALAFVLLAVSAPSTAADATAEPLPGSQSVEVPEAGLALSFPPDWSIDIEMRQREDWGLFDEGFAEEPVVFWNVVYASDAGSPWCEVVWYPAHPLSLADHAARYEALMTPTHSDVERPIEVASLTLPAGEAYRLVIYNAPSDDHTTVYLVDADEARYMLECVGVERAEDDWLALAETLHLQPPPEDAGDVAVEEE